MEPAQVTTTITDGSVQAALSFPLLVSKDDLKFKMTNFKADINVELPRIYELAREITKLEKNDRFIEEHVVNMLSIYSGVDKNRLPLMGTDFKFGGAPIYWNVLDVKNQLVQEVLSKVSGLRINGTNNFVAGAAVSDFKDIEVFFTFPDNRPFYFKINGLPKGIVGPNTITKDVAFMKFVFNQYQFSYDFSFPVLVTLKMLNGLDGQDYEFQFALEGNVRANSPLFEGHSPIHSNQASTMMCDENQALSGDVHLRAQTGNNAPIGGVDFYYDCAGQGCYVGKTDSTGQLTANLPVCIGGMIVPVKERFVGDPKQYDAELGKSGSVSMKLAETKAFKLDFKKLIFKQEDSKWPNQNTDFKVSDYTPTVARLDSDESVIVMFKRIADGGLSSYKFPAEISGDGELPDVYLAAGDYEVSMLLMKEKQLVIPEKTCPEHSLLPCVPHDELKMDEMQYGGGTITNFKLDDMDKDQITLFGLYFDVFSIPKDELDPQDLTVVTNMDDYLPYFEKYKPVLS